MFLVFDFRMDLLGAKIKNSKKYYSLGHIISDLFLFGHWRFLLLPSELPGWPSPRSQVLAGESSRLVQKGGQTQEQHPQLHHLPQVSWAI